MTEVVLHIYDVTNSGSEKTNNTIVQINKIFKDGIGLGGIFHSAVQVRSLYTHLKQCMVVVAIDNIRSFFSMYEFHACCQIEKLVYGEDEWSFGFCEQGTGVFSCPSGKNPMYTYREAVVLGKTNSSIFKVNQILRELSREWPGSSYDLLSKNCNHFCDEFCERLGVQKLPASMTGWVNRFANAGDTAMEVAGNTALRFRQAKTEIVTASKVAYRFLLGVTNNVTNNVKNPESPNNSNREGSPRFQASWLKNIIANGAKPSTSSEGENQNGVVPLPPTREDDKALLHCSSSHDS
ncbi:hypothetical protein Fmac_015981 [Flemingia macrophylla]|uniref:PPPDE domain-containing protein n=1 Tax=Flemingia macrophylla TaxID=520843 RepID=A0ABD1MG26_9FABA